MQLRKACPTFWALPFHSPQLYERLGYGWGNSLLGFLCLAMGVPAPLLLWKWVLRSERLGEQTIESKGLGPISVPRNIS